MKITWSTMSWVDTLLCEVITAEREEKERLGPESFSKVELAYTIRQRRSYERGTPFLLFTLW